MVCENHFTDQCSRISMFVASCQFSHIKMTVNITFYPDDFDSIMSELKFGLVEFIERPVVLLSWKTKNKDCLTRVQ